MAVNGSPAEVAPVSANRWPVPVLINTYALDRLRYKYYTSGTSRPITYCYDGQIFSPPKGCRMVKNTTVRLTNRGPLASPCAVEV
jgi:hypothetical protein